MSFVLISERTEFISLYGIKYGTGQLSRYSDQLLAGLSGDRIPVGEKFSAPVQTVPGAHPTSYTMGKGCLPGVKRPGRGADDPPPSKCRGHERVGLYLYSPSGPSWPVMGRNFIRQQIIVVYNQNGKCLLLRTTGIFKYKILFFIRMHSLAKLSPTLQYFKHPCFRSAIIGTTMLSLMFNCAY